MSLSTSPEVEAKLADFRAYLNTESSREAFDLLVSIARKDDRYSLEPRGKMGQKKSLEYTIGAKWSYGVIINSSDLLFYYRKPSGRTSDTVLANLIGIGLKANKNPLDEICVRITNSRDVNAIIADCFGEAMFGDNRQRNNDGRLSSDLLDEVTPVNIWISVQRLLEGYKDHPFGDFVDYYVLADGGVKLPPKAVFGIAATEALGFEVKPKDFTSGVGSQCFKILERSGFPVHEVALARVDESGGMNLFLDIVDAEFREGTLKVRMHLQRERAPGLRQAKIASFRKLHQGRLYCEHCDFEPVVKYPLDVAESCMEVHRKRSSNPSHSGR